MFVFCNFKINFVKLMELNYFEDGDLFMCVYKFNWISIDVVVVIEIKIFYLEIKFMVVVRYGKKLIVKYFDYGYVFFILEVFKKMKKWLYLFMFVVFYIFLNILLFEGINVSFNGFEVELLVNIIVK